MSHQPSEATGAAGTAGGVGLATAVLRRASGEWPVAIVLEGMPEGESAALGAIEGLRQGLVGCRVLVLVTQWRDEVLEMLPPEVVDVITDVVILDHPSEPSGLAASVGS
jgi:hypothetical protein